MNKTHFFPVLVLFLVACNGSIDQEHRSNDSTAISMLSGSKPVTVTTYNFNRAETDMYFATAVKLAGGTGKLHHYRELMPIDNQTVIRANRDVLYSSGVFDLEAGPVTITLPDPGKRFMSMIVIDEDQYAETVYAPGSFTYTKDKVGTRYVMCGLRTFIDPNDPKDHEMVTALQDNVQVVQENAGRFETPNWDSLSQKQVRDSLIEVSKTFPDTRGMFGQRGKVDEVRHLIGSATGWGGNAEKDAFYVIRTPAKNDGTTVHKLKLKTVPVDGFWSVSVYNKEGYFQKNDLNSYSVNNITAKKDADGSVSIQFGGCENAKNVNCIPVSPGWNYWVRLYRPHKEVLDGTWKFPEAMPVK